MNFGNLPNPPLTPWFAQRWKAIPFTFLERKICKIKLQSPQIQHTTPAPALYMMNLYGPTLHLNWLQLQGRQQVIYIHNYCCQEPSTCWPLERGLLYQSQIPRSLSPGVDPAKITSCVRTANQRPRTWIFFSSMQVNLFMLSVLHQVPSHFTNWLGTLTPLYICTYQCRFPPLCIRNFMTNETYTWVFLNILSDCGDALLEK
jgi:hypothetical protein